MAEPHIGDLVLPACEFANEPGHVCAGRIEWHHVIKKQRIKDRFPRGAYRGFDAGTPWQPLTRTGSYFPPGHIEYLPLAEILADPRNRMWLCKEGAHEPVTNARSRFPIPMRVWDFANDFGMTGALENDLAKQR